MRLTKIGIILCSLAALPFAVLVSSANGTMLVSETFTYPDGNLVPNDPPIGGAWNAHSGAAVTPIQVSSGTIGLVQGGGTREDDNVPFETGAIGAGDVVYSGFDLTVPDPGAAIVDTYFGMFLQGTSNFTSRVWVTAPTTSGYRLALSNDNSITDADGEARSTDLAFGTTYRVITKYDFDNQNGMLWIDPVNESSASISATDPGFSDAVSAYAFRQATGNTVQTLDNLYVSTTFQGALTGAEVPEPASVGLVMVAGLALMFIRKRAS